MILVLFYVWEDVRICAPWNYSFDSHLITQSPYPKHSTIPVFLQPAPQHPTVPWKRNQSASSHCTPSTGNEKKDSWPLFPDALKNSWPQWIKLTAGTVIWAFIKVLKYNWSPEQGIFKVRLAQFFQTTVLRVARSDPTPGVQFGISVNLPYFLLKETSMEMYVKLTALAWLWALTRDFLVCWVFSVPLTRNRMCFKRWKCLTYIRRYSMILELCK